jgi:hypothetical protein
MLYSDNRKERIMNCLLALLLLLAPHIVWSGDGDGYGITVIRQGSIPDARVLDDALAGFSSGLIEEFLRNFREFSADFPEQFPWNLEITFTHEPSPDGLVCVMAWIWEYTGGAHGNTGTRAFILDQERSVMVEPTSLFVNEQNFTAFATMVKKLLRQELGEDFWIDEGASPSPKNYHSLLPVPDESGAIGAFRVLFPPYQVAPYVFGIHDFTVELRSDSRLDSQNGNPIMVFVGPSHMPENAGVQSESTEGTR